MNATTMQTYSGKLVDLANFTPDDVRLPDISHALSQVVRYTGHTTYPLSVAEHSVTVSRVCDPADALWGLLHDASEAYLGDVSRPLKRLLPDYQELEEHVQQVIAKAFGLSWPIPESVHVADMRVLMTEKHALMTVNHDWGIGVEPAPVAVCCMVPRLAKELFEARFKELRP